jgi:hypothetical protein
MEFFQTCTSRPRSLITTLFHSKKFACFESVGSRFPPKPKWSLQKSTSIRDYMRTCFYTVSQRGLQLTFRMHNSDSIPEIRQRNSYLSFRVTWIWFAFPIASVVQIAGCRVWNWYLKNSCPVSTSFKIYKISLTYFFHFFYFLDFNFMSDLLHYKWEICIPNMTV